jgi:hypothetical protein
VFKHANWKEPVEFMHHCSTKWATFLLNLRDLGGRGVVGGPICILVHGLGKKCQAMAGSEEGI